MNPGESSSGAQSALPPDAKGAGKGDKSLAKPRVEYQPDQAFSILTASQVHLFYHENVVTKIQEGEVRVAGKDARISAESAAQLVQSHTQAFINLWRGSPKFDGETKTIPDFEHEMETFCDRQYSYAEFISVLRARCTAATFKRIMKEVYPSSGGPDFLHCIPRDYTMAAFMKGIRRVFGVSTEKLERDLARLEMEGQPGDWEVKEWCRACQDLMEGLDRKDGENTTYYAIIGQLGRSAPGLDPTLFRELYEGVEKGDYASKVDLFRVIEQKVEAWARTQRMGRYGEHCEYGWDGTAFFPPSHPPPPPPSQGGGGRTMAPHQGAPPPSLGHRGATGSGSMARPGLGGSRPTGPGSGPGQRWWTERHGHVAHEGDQPSPDPSHHLQQARSRYEQAREAQHAPRQPNTQGPPSRLRMVASRMGVGEVRAFWEDLESRSFASRSSRVFTNPFFAPEPHGDGGSLSEEPVYCTHLPEPAPQAISKHLAALIQVVDVGAREGASGSWVTSHTHGVPHAGLGSAPSHILLRRSPYHAERVPLRYQKDENADDTSMGDAAWGFGDGRSVQGSWVEGQETFVHLPSAHEASAGCGAVHGASGFTHEDTFCGRELEPVNMCQDPTPLLQRGPDWAWDDEGEGGLSGCPSRTHMIAARAHVEGLDEEAELLSGGMPLGMIVQHPGRPPDEFVCHSPSHVPENHARVLEYHAFTSGASELPKSEPPEHLAHMARVGQHILGNWLLAHMAGMPDQDGDWGVQPSQTHMDASWAQGDAGRGRHWSFRAGHYPGRPPDEVLTGTDSGLPVGGNQLRLDCEHMIRGTQVGWPREVREPPGRPPDANQTTL